MMRKFDLKIMKELAEIAGHPETCAPSIHIAGSKGKGSVTGMISGILNAFGIKTACYTSPHVSDFRERLTIGGEFFNEEIYASAGKELMETAGIYTARNGNEPSYFELLTLWFFLLARKSHCGAMAVETGMGGRLDATNILSPLVSVITLIELEHTEYLGDTIAAISAEKAGIIKSGKPLILAEQSSTALEVFKEHSSCNRSPLFYFPDYVELSDIRVDRKGTSFSLVLKLKDSETFGDLFVPMSGEIQAKNAALAILAVKTAFPNIDTDSIRKGLGSFSLPARFEQISEKPPVLIDGAHTRRSIELCLDTFCNLYGSGGILVFGCAAGKDVLSMAKLCIGSFSIIIITTPGTFKKSFPEEIYKTFKNLTAELRGGEDKNKFDKIISAPEILFIPDTAKAIDCAIELANKNSLPVLGTGSFYLAAEIRNKFLVHL